MTKIGTIAQELKKCRAAWEKHPGATWAWCCHHEVHFEPLTEPSENRISVILNNKPSKEKSVRLRNFRPFKNAAAVKTASDAYYAAVKTASEPLRKMHNSDWPDNTWSGASIFKPRK